MDQDRSIRILDQELLDEFERTLSRQPGGQLSDASRGRARDEIIAAFEGHGITPSQEAVLWWSWRDGFSREVLPGLQHLAFEHALRGLVQFRELAAELAASPPASDPDLWWNPGWIPIFDSGGSPKIAIDCSGPPDAPSPLRQVDWHSFGTDHYAQTLAPSLGEYIARAVQSIEDGRYHYDADRDHWWPMDRA